MMAAVSFLLAVAGTNFLFISPAINKQSAVASFSFPAGVSASDVKPCPGGVLASSADAADKLPQCDFKSHKGNIVFGQPARLYWDCIKADECSITDMGKVPVSQKTGIEFIPRKTAIYTLTCGNEFGSRSFDAPIRVFEFTIEKTLEEGLE